MDTTLRLVWFRCGFATSFVWKTLGTNFRNLATETAVFHFNVLGPSLRFIFVISLPCSHGLRFDGMTFVLELQTACQFFLAIRTDFNFIFLLDGNTGRLNWQTSSYLQIFFFGNDFELLEVFEHCISIFVELASWTTSVGKVSSRWGPSTSNWICEKSLIVTSGWGGIQKRTSKRNFKLRGPKSWTRTSPWRNFDFSTRSNIVKNFWHSKKSSGLNFVFLIFDLLNFKINVEWYFKILRSRLWGHESSTSASRCG